MISNLKSSIIVKAVAGELVAQEQLLDYCRPLIRVAARRCFDKFLQQRFDASDIVQMTCMEAHAALPSFRGTSYPELLCWLQTILERTVSRVRNEHLGTKRDVRREVVIDEGLSGLSFVWTSVGRADSGPSSKLILGETAILVAAALEQLSNEYRTVIELRFLDGMKLAEIAAHLQVTPGCVAGRLRRGLAMLHDSLPESIAAELRGPGT